MADDPIEDVDAATVAELRDEIARLRAEVARLRAKNDGLLADALAHQYERPPHYQ